MKISFPKGQNGVMARNNQTKARLKPSQANPNSKASCWASGTHDSDQLGSKDLEAFYSSNSAAYSTHSLSFRLALLNTRSIPKQTFYSSGISNTFGYVFQFKHHLTLFIRQFLKVILQRLRLQYTLTRPRSSLKAWNQTP